MADYLWISDSDKRSLIDLTLNYHADTIYVELTSRCNLRCLYCKKSLPGNDAVPGRNVDMSEDTIERTLNLIKTAGFKHISLSGTGETTHMKNWMEVCSRFFDLGLKNYMLNSNFTRMFSKDELEFLLNFSSIMVSLDTADAAVLKSVRGADLRAITTNIVMLRARARALGRKATPILINCTVTSTNAFLLADLATYCAEMKVHGLMLNSLFDYEDRQHTDTVKAVENMDAQGLQTLREQISEAMRILKEAGIPMGVMPRLIDTANGIKETLQPEMTRVCDPPWHQLTVGADGQLFPCCVTIDNVGNIRDSENAQELLNSETFRAFRYHMLNGPMPKGCRLCNNAQLGGRDQLFRQVVQTKVQRQQYLTTERLPPGSKTS